MLPLGPILCPDQYHVPCGLTLDSLDFSGVPPECSDISPEVRGLFVKENG